MGNQKNNKGPVVFDPVEYAYSKYINNKVISGYPGDGPYEVLKIVQADDEKMVIIFKAHVLEVLVFLFFGGMIGFLLWAFLLDTLVSLIMSPILIITSLWVLKKLYDSFPRKVTFHRKKGVVEVPAPWFRGWDSKNTIFLDFISLEFTTVGYTLRGPGTKKIKYPDTHFHAIDMRIGSLSPVLDFLMWYMDPNRPLPPGKIFDPYRQADFERRRAEGFPLPLLESRIKTSEATKEQQQERDAMWPQRMN